MGVILKYLIDFPDADFKVSNDLLKGDFLIDVSVHVGMLPGALGTTFTLDLIDLPEAKSKKLEARVKDPTQSHISIKLGYFDGSFETVMDGVYTHVERQVTGENLVTKLKGEETATYALNHTTFQQGLTGKVTFDNLAGKVLLNAFPDSKDAAPSGGLVAAAAALISGAASSTAGIDTKPITDNLKGELDGPSLKGATVMDVLNDLAEIAHAELFVTDRKVFLGKPVQNDATYKPVPFDRNVNLAIFRPFTEILPEDQNSNRIEKLPAHEVLGFHFTIAGDPQLRPGNKVASDVDGFGKNDGEYRVLRVEHILNLSQGYVCLGKALKACSDNNCRRRQTNGSSSSAEDIALRLSQRIKDEPRRRPVIEICAVKSYKAGGVGVNPHQATLSFGQRFDKAETQPSLRAAVEDEDAQLFANKPIVSAFAWHKCGLVTPVYPGMKAVVAHNLGLTDDGLVTGFLWSEQPAFAPPQSQAGDWWLCLPVNFDGKTPTDSTKAVNDLIANNGHRVIEVSGLRITVGKSTLGTVGARPTEGDDDDLLLEHKPSGTKLAIDKDGVLTITGNKGTTLTIDKNGGLTIDCKDALSFTAKSVSFKGDVTIEGNVDIK
jgi:hypothetical protein